MPGPARPCPLSPWYLLACALVLGSAACVSPPLVRPGDDAPHGTLQARVVRADTGQPVAGGDVALGHLEHQTTDFQGAFRYERVRQGRHVLEVTHPDTVPAHLGSVEVLADRVTDLGEVLVQPGAVLEGRVLDSMGAPLPGVEVGLLDETAGTGDAGPVQDLSEVRRVHADDGGAYELRGLAAGRYSLCLLAGGGGDKSDVGPEEAAEEPARYLHVLHRRTVELRPGAVTEADLVLGPTVRWTGTVWSGGRPVPQAELWIIPEPPVDLPAEAEAPVAGWALARADARGLFSIDLLPPGRYRVRAWKRGHSTFSRAAEPCEPPDLGEKVESPPFRVVLAPGIPEQYQDVQLAVPPPPGE